MAVSWIPEVEERYCKHLKLKRGFLKSIASDSDWGFVIKAHALIEASLTTLIVTRFDEPMLAGIISNLQTSSEDDSKLAILKELELIDPKHRGFIRNFSRMRNCFAHDIRKMDCSIEQYLNEEKQEKRATEFRKAIANAGYILDQSDPSASYPSKLEFIKDHIRTAIWITVLAVSYSLLITTEAIREQQEAFRKHE